MFCQDKNESWLRQAALEFMTEEADAKAPLETGGVLIGYLAQPGNIPVILCASGPGPRALHGQAYYRPDHQHDEALISAFYEESGRRLIYLGDWHTHPAPVYNLSWRDRRTLKRIARCKSARISTPVMIILAFDREWTPVVWQGWLAGRASWWRRLYTDELAARLF